jgi:diguanylate cyclase (GGDEF)-like protein
VVVALSPPPETPLATRALRGLQERSELHERGTPAASWWPAPRPRPRVLVAAGELAGLEWLERVLDDGGFDVISAPDGAAALRLTRDCTPDVLLLDARLPVLDGVAVCREVQQAGLSAPPVVLMGGYVRAADRVAGLDAGAVDYVAVPFDAGELAARIRAALRTKALQDALLAAAAIDPLTGVPNRRCLDERAREAIALAQRHRRPLACLYVDLDGFKTVNDTFGHRAGDAVLRHVVEVIGACTRASDVVARYGGDEFVLLLPETDQDGALAVAEKICAAIEAVVVTGAGPELDATREMTADAALGAGDTAVRISASVGVACWEPAMGDPDELLAAADAAMYRAKRQGRNRAELARCRPASWPIRRVPLHGDGADGRYSIPRLPSLGVGSRPWLQRSTLHPLPSTLYPLDQIDGAGGGVDTEPVAGADRVDRVRLEPVHQRHTGEHGALHHDRVGLPEEDGQRGGAALHHVAQHPRRGDAAFCCGADQHLSH